ncbi:hypothetical protein BDV96DRAFT_583636 [Lophiotrema nucula]|uniref:TPR domain-containing protein n=1 Tax=Lophiotrema nucula TaxID=690887 RepID=A0A6A5YUA8_9PLEO|nr:hypothetical protein BDV96DRAFT_583636 [Lophiotrema nucula]
MYSRAIPRVASKASRFAQCDAHPQAHVFGKLPSRTWKPIQQHYSRRCESSFARQLRENYRRSPIAFPFAAGSVLLLATFAVVYIPWYYRNVILKPYHRFPEPVAKKLRRAMFYSSGKNLDMMEANKYFRQALTVSQEIGMDQFSDEILGVKLLVSHLYENCGHYSLAAEVMEIMRADLKRWMDEFGDKHWTDGDRTRIMIRRIELDVKLGQLYDLPYLNEPDNAEKVLTEAVTIALQEQARRQDEGAKEGEGDWLSNEQMGGTLEALGQHFEQFDAHYLATPLFLQALALCPPNSCHGVVLMNNVSTCLAQQTAPPASSRSSSPNSFPNLPPVSRDVLVDQAREWAQKALDRAATIAPPDRDEECDIACATATHNLAEFLEMQGRVGDAWRKYKEAESLAKAIGFSEGVANAREGQKRLREK